MKNTKKDKYYIEMNYLKGLAIIWVLIGHSFTDYQTGFINPVNKFIFYYMYSFHMPLFFLISGFLFTKQLTDKWPEKVGTIRKKFIHLFIPYLVYSFLTLILKVAFSQYAFHEFTISEFYKIFLSSNPNGGLWFLYVLFFITVIASVLLNQKHLRTYILFIISLFTFSLSNYLPSDVYFIARIFQNLPYFILGIILNYHYAKVQKTLQKNYLIGILTFGISCLLLNQMDFAKINYFMFLLAICGSITSYVLISFLPPKSKIAQILNTISHYAMAIYLLSYFVSVPFKLIASYLSFPYYLTFFLNIGLSCLIPMLIAKYIIRDNKLLNILLLGNQHIK